MFKLVVLSALLATAAAEPGVFYSTPLAPTTYAASIAAPVASTYVQHSSSYVAPTVYSDIAYPHLIKKRSPQLLSNYVSPWLAGSPLVTPYASTLVAPTPLTYSSSILPAIAAPAHFIKKRSPQFLGNYVAPYVAGTPLVTPYASTYVAPAPITYSSSVLPAIAAPAHFIKKRSTALLSAPASYVAGTPLASAYLASAPVATTYSSGIIPSASYYSAYPGYVAGVPFIKK